MAEQTRDVTARSGRTPASGLDLIVAGFDTSSQAQIAVRWAAEIAQSTSSALRVVWAWHVRDVWDEALKGQPFAGAPPMTDLTSAAQRRLETAVRGLIRGTVSTVDCRAQNGDPAKVLLAASTDADMLFLGSRGRGSVRSALLGSVSTRCLREAACPVVVIPHHMVPQRSADQR